MIECRTLTELAADGTRFTTYCTSNECHHSRPLNLDALAKRLGDLDFFAVNLRPRMRCTKCDRRGATFIVSPSRTRYHWRHRFDARQGDCQSAFRELP